MIVDSGVDAGNEKKAQDEILRQLDAMRNGEFTDEELENTKKYICGAFRSYYDSAEDMNMWYFYEFARGTADAPTDAIEKIMAVTREDIINSAQSFKLDTVYTLTPSGGEENA
jgi:predicted Zn-dependent peptidase